MTKNPSSEIIPKWNLIDYSQVNLPELRARHILVWGPKGVRDDIWVTGNNGRWYSKTPREESIAWIELPSERSPYWRSLNDLEQIWAEGLPFSQTTVVKYYTTSRELKWKDAHFNLSKHCWEFRDGTLAKSGFVHGGLIVFNSPNIQENPNSDSIPIHGQLAPIWN